MVIVIYTEYERGWGSKDFHEKEFKTLKEAKAEVEKVLEENSGEEEVPDYYIRARIKEENGN